MVPRQIPLYMALLGLCACGAVPTSNPASEPVADPVSDAVPLLSDVELADTDEAVALTSAPSANEGLLSQILGNGETESDAVDAAVVAAVDGTTSPDQPASLPPSTGLFGRIFQAGTGVSAPQNGPEVTDQVPPRTAMAFGDIAPTCGLATGDLGTEIASASGYKIYDTIPNSTAPRPHYISGFRDGCARQFTAALVILGDVGTHELVRYSRTRVELSYSKTDNAYEAIKSSFCRVGFGQPCGNRLERLARSTTFVTAYERFGAGPVWAEFLLHDGTVAAADIEGD